MALDPRLLEILACPLCKGKLHYRPQQNALLCRADRLSFPIEEGIPQLLEERAQSLSAEELP